MQPEEKLDAARFQIFRKNAFFSSVIGQLGVILDDSPTAWTDSRRIGIGREFIRPATVGEVVGTILHEVGHVIFEHTTLLLEGKYDPWILNIAGDHQINLWLFAHGFELPKSITPYADKKYSGWTTLQIYNDLIKNPPPPMPNGMGQDMKEPLGSPEEVKERLDQVIIQATIQADRMDRSRDVPQNVRRHVDKLLNPKVPWESVLQEYMSAYNKQDYTYRRLNRRFMPDFMLPTLFSEAMGEVALVTDVSGSITQQQFDSVTAEAGYIHDVMKPEKTHVLCFHTDLCLNEEFEEGDYIGQMDIPETGGTDIQCVIDWLEANQPQVAIIFTDGYFNYNTEMFNNIESDIIWVLAQTNKTKEDFPNDLVIEM